MDAEIQVVIIIDGKEETKWSHIVKQKNVLFLRRSQRSDLAEQGAPVWHLEPRSLMLLAY